MTSRGLREPPTSPPGTKASNCALIALRQFSMVSARFLLRCCGLRCSERARFAKKASLTLSRVLWRELELGWQAKRTRHSWNGDYLLHDRMEIIRDRSKLIYMYILRHLQDLLILPEKISRMHLYIFFSSISFLSRIFHVTFSRISDFFLLIFMKFKQLSYKKHIDRILFPGQDII